MNSNQLARNGQVLVELLESIYYSLLIIKCLLTIVWFLCCNKIRSTHWIYMLDRNGQYQTYPATLDTLQHKVMNLLYLTHCKVHNRQLPYIYIYLIFYSNNKFTSFAWCRGGVANGETACSTLMKDEMLRELFVALVKVVSKIQKLCSSWTLI